MHVIKQVLGISALAYALFSVSAADLTGLGLVDFKTCVERSKHGQRERGALEDMKNKMTETLEKMEHELEEMAKKLEDQDYMDSLSPTAEQELKQKFQSLSQDFARCQNQYYQLLQQANYTLLQTLHDEVSHAAERVRSHNQLALLLSEDAAFAYSSALDYTDEVVREMDQEFATENDTSSEQTH